MWEVGNFPSCETSPLRVDKLGCFLCWFLFLHTAMNKTCFCLQMAAGAMFVYILIRKDGGPERKYGEHS